VGDEGQQQGLGLFDVDGQVVGNECDEDQGQEEAEQENPALGALVEGPAEAGRRSFFIPSRSRAGAADPVSAWGREGRLLEQSIQKNVV